MELIIIASILIITISVLSIDVNLRKTRQQNNKIIELLKQMRE